MGGKRRATRVAVPATAVTASPAFRPHAPDWGSGLPHDLLLRIWALVPVASRVSCALVCRAWRKSLEDKAAWRVFDMSDSAPFYFSFKNRCCAHWLAAATGRAGGCIETLSLPNPVW